jgi:hypothetical protein
MLKASELFLHLVWEIGRTISHEQEVFDRVAQWAAVKDYEYAVDEENNHYVVVGHPSIAFASHLDTVVTGDTRIVLPPVKDINDRVWMGTMAGNLGADCRAGVAIMTQLLSENVPGLYCFFSREEGGRKGSEYAAEQARVHKRIGTDDFNVPLDEVKAMISFDRYGYESVITKQSGIQTASDRFAQALAARIGDWACKDPAGSYTDSYSFRALIPECTNVSVGYFGHHTEREVQDLSYLDTVTDRFRVMHYASLPIEREPVLDAWEANKGRVKSRVKSGTVAGKGRKRWVYTAGNTDVYEYDDGTRVYERRADVFTDGKRNHAEKRTELFGDGGASATHGLHALADGFYTDVWDEYEAAAKPKDKDESKDDDKLVVIDMSAGEDDSFPANVEDTPDPIESLESHLIESVAACPSCIYDMVTEEVDTLLDMVLLHLTQNPQDSIERLAKAGLLHKFNT